MRSLLAAAVVLALAVTALLAAPVSAEPPPPMESRDARKVLAAVSAAPGRKSDAATLRFYVEVLEQSELEAPVGSPLTTLGAWGDNGALLQSEALLDGCKPRSPAAEKKAAALLASTGEALPPLLRAFVLGRTGKKAEAAALLTGFLEAQPAGACPSEHPMYSYRRVARMRTALQCLQAFEPARDLSKLEARLKQAERCAATNHAVG